jgi:hypothetical protein
LEIGCKLQVRTWTRKLSDKCHHQVARGNEEWLVHMQLTHFKESIGCEEVAP